jgi:hypothetical protein
MAAADTIMFTLFTAAMRCIRAAMSLVTCMIRMNISTCKTTYKSSHETPVAYPAGMNAETYDTEAVPYHKQQRAESEKSTFHTNMQS